MSRRRYGEKGQPYQHGIKFTYKAILPSKRPQRKKNIVNFFFVKKDNSLTSIYGKVDLLSLVDYFQVWQISHNKMATINY